LYRVHLCHYTQLLNGNLGSSIVGQQDQKNHQSGSPIKVDIQQDVNWLLQSQPLMSATPEVTIFKPQDTVHETDLSSMCLCTYPAQPAYRLGKHFEDCVDRLFASSSTNNIIARNLVIQTPERTLGELDLIYQNKSSEIVHLELAIKFYLLKKGGTQLIDFVGPAGHDRLDLKWDRLRLHQLSLSQTAEALDFLQQQHVPLPTRQQLLLTGMLFYAYENWQSTVVEDIGLNPQHQRGWWIEHHEVAQLKTIHGPQRGFIILPKWHWIGGPRHYSEPQPICYNELILRTTADPWPNMVLIYEHTDRTQPWVFKNRGLILATKKPPLVS
jgi:hypothetical protein